MTRIRAGEHLLVNVSRRSLCDNCIADVCTRRGGGRLFECELYRPPFLIIKRCGCCGELFEVYQNIRALDADLCMRCNLHLDDSE